MVAPLLLLFLAAPALGQKALTVEQHAAGGNEPIVIVQATQWVESLTLIACTLITAVVAPVVVMWARKRFAVRNGT